MGLFQALCRLVIFIYLFFQFCPQKIQLLLLVVLIIFQPLQNVQFASSQSLKLWDLILDLDSPEWLHVCVAGCGLGGSRAAGGGVCWRPLTWNATWVGGMASLLAPVMSPAAVWPVLECKAPEVSAHRNTSLASVAVRSLRLRAEDESASLAMKLQQVPPSCVPHMGRGGGGASGGGGF